MTDNMFHVQYGDYSRIARMAELRMPGVQHDMLLLDPGEERVMRQPGRTCFYFVRRGNGMLTVDSEPGVTHYATPGTAIALEDGAIHRWRADMQLDQPLLMLTGEVDRRHTIIQKLSHSIIIMPADAQPHATIVAHAVAAVEASLNAGPYRHQVQRRFAEIVHLQMLEYANEQLERVGPIPPAVQHDPALLRAWTAFLNAPDLPWTLEKMAMTGGLSRATLARRFEQAVGVPPHRMMRWLRIGYAADMLQNSAAPIAEIALKVGYRSDIALMRAFRQERGVTPAQWRKQSRDAMIPPIMADRFNPAGVAPSADS